MNKFFTLCVSFLFALNFAIAQQPDDALRFAWFIPGGTARYTAIGGTNASLGGDITSNHVNPAGIGLFKTNEVVLSPSYLLNNNNNLYLNSKSGNTQSAINYGTTGVIFGSPSRYKSSIASTTFSISINQLASYNNHTYYQGNNNYSSYSEKYLEELTRDNASPTAAEQNYIFGSSLAYRTYLIDSLNVNGQFVGYRSLVPISTGVKQENDETTKGGLHELSLAFASNVEDRLYLGISLNLQIMSYNRDLVYSETDISGDPNNNFDYFTYSENYKTNGAGLNAKLGLIYKTQNGLRVGVAFHTPTIMDLTDKIRSSMTTNTEAYAGLLSESSDNLNSGDPGQVQYRVVTPWHALGSISYVFNSVEDTKKQRGFISADLEYVNYRGTRYSVAPQNTDDQVGKDYYTSLNDVIKDYYKGNVNVKVGGEIKYDPWSFRLGTAYYGSPYSDKTLKASRILAAGGIGYRNHGFYIDITLAEILNKDVNFPYRLNDKANVFASTKDNRTNIIATFGFKF